MHEIRAAGATCKFLDYEDGAEVTQALNAAN